jgi:hypothetical protein
MPDAPKTASYATHRLIQSLARSPELVERYRASAGAVFDEFSVPAAEREAFSSSAPGALSQIGVHPILQIQYLLATDPAMRSRLSVTAYLDRIKRG